jgi:DNA-binding SARP family transcriptional activator
MTLLGRAGIRAGEESARFPTRRALALCAYLALEGVTPRSRLISLLWEEHTESSARVNLRQELSRVRRTPIGPHLLVDGEHLRLSDDVQTDVADFLRSARDLDYAGALAQYSGALLDGTEFDDAPELATWLEEQRSHFHERWTTTLAAQAHVREEEGAVHEALALWQQLLRTDELRESWHAEAMRLHLQLGEREAALRQFARCSDLLRTELGLSPLPETLRLAEQARSPQVPVRIVSAPSVSVPTPLPPALVGREDLWAILRKRPPAVLLLGEPGIGKSTLARAACGMIKVLTLTGHEAALNIPFSPATAALERHLPGLSDAERAELFPMLPGRKLPPDPALRAGFQRAVARIIEDRLGADGILLLDDLHWFDSATLEVMPAVLERCRQVGTWVVATARPHELSLNAAASKLFGPETLRLTLTPLEGADLARLTSEWTEAEPDPAFVTWLQEATAGNPLAVRETLRLLRDTQGSGPLSIPAESEAAPVRALILQRLERLGAEARRVLEAASVSSGSFSVRELAGTTALDEWACLEVLEGAVLAGMLEDVGGNFRFAHDLIRRAILSSLSPARAALLHRHMAAVLEKSGGPLESVAQHLEAAGEDASDWWWRAARAAERVYAYPQALAHSQRALEGHLNSEVRLAVHRRRLLWWRTVDDRSGWKTEVERLEALAYREGEASWWTEARLARLEWLFQGGRYHEVLELGEVVLPDPNITPEQHARALLECGNACVYLGRHADAQRQLKSGLMLEGVTLAGMPELFGRLNHSLTASALETGDLEMARHHAELARQGFERAGSRMGQLRSVFNSFAIAERSGESEQAREFGLLALDLARDLDDKHHQRTALFNLAAQAISVDNRVEAKNALLKLTDLKFEGEDIRQTWWFNYLCGEVARMYGEIGKAIDLFSESERAAILSGSPEQVVKARVASADLLLDLEYYDLAIETLINDEYLDINSISELSLLEYQMVTARILEYSENSDIALKKYEKILENEMEYKSKSQCLVILNYISLLIKCVRYEDALFQIKKLKYRYPISIEARIMCQTLKIEKSPSTIAAAEVILLNDELPPIERLDLLKAVCGDSVKSGIHTAVIKQLEFQLYIFDKTV